MCGAEKVSSIDQRYDERYLIRIWTYSRESKKKDRMEEQQNKLRVSHRKAIDAINKVEARMEAKVCSGFWLVPCFFRIAG